MEIRWFTTASIEISDGKEKILFDPFVPLKGAEITADIEEYDGYNYIFLSHGHFDHASCVPDIVKRNEKAEVYCTETPAAVLAEKGVPEDNIRLIGAGDVIKAGSMSIEAYRGKHAVLPGFSFRRLSSVLFSKNISNLPYILKQHGLWKEKNETLVYVIRHENETVVLLGSMNLDDDTEYPEEADILVLPYNGWEDNFIAAVKVIERLKPFRILVDHYDSSFPPVTEKIDVSPLIEKYQEAVICERGKTYVSYNAD